MEEIWKDIKGYEGLYQVSNMGRVKSLAREVQTTNVTGNYMIKERILKLGLSKGYYSVNLFKHGKGKVHRIHRLVAETFIPNPNNLPQVNHIDENILNNFVNNLEWCTKEYNLEYGTRVERMVNTRKEKLINCKKVRCITTGKEFNSLREAGDYYNCTLKSDMNKIVRGIRKHCGRLSDGTPLEWEYIKQDKES